MPSRFLIPFAFAVCLSPVAAQAADRPVVVELFTSQGCSSCPPANAYLNEMVRDRRDVLALAFHVGSDRGEVGPAIEQAKRQGQTAATVDIRTEGDQLSINVGSGSGSGRVLLIGFDHDHQTAIRHGENGGRTLQESNVVRSIRSVGDWKGAALRISEKRPEGQDAAVIIEAPDGRIVGASKPLGG